jgi:hypothetical protein
MSTRLANLTLLVAALALAGGAGELLLRARVGTPIHWRFPQERYEPDPELGYRMAADQRSYTHDAPVATNSLGLRDGSYAPQATAGTLRVLALGDSQTFGNGLALADTWPKQLETGLAAGPGRWQVINAGLAGSNTWQHERMLVRLHRAYRPQFAVVGFYVNDVQERPSDPTRVSQSDRETNTWSKRLGYALKRSALFTASWQARHTLAALWRGSDASDDWETRVLTGDEAPQIEAGWRQVENSLAAMKAFSDAHALRLVVLVIPRRDQVSGREPSTGFQKRLARLTARLALENVDPLPALREAHAEHGSALFIAWDGHNSAIANGVMAGALQRRLAMLSAGMR